MDRNFAPQKIIILERNSTMFSFIYIQSKVNQKPIINPAPINQVCISSASYPLAMYIASGMPAARIKVLSHHFGTSRIHLAKHQQIYSGETMFSSHIDKRQKRLLSLRTNTLD